MRLGIARSIRRTDAPKSAKRSPAKGPAIDVNGGRLESGEMRGS